MKAMIFAAGTGSRLKPLTDHTPKALIPIGGKPMLEHVILKLKSSGFDQIVINIHHLGNQIVDFLELLATSVIHIFNPFNSCFFKKGEALASHATGAFFATVHAYKRHILCLLAFFRVLCYHSLGQGRLRPAPALENQSVFLLVCFSWFLALFGALRSFEC